MLVKYKISKEQSKSIRTTIQLLEVNTNTDKMIEKGGGKRLTSIKPKNQRLRRRVFSSLNEPVEESPPRVLIDRDIPRIVSKRDIKGLSR